MGQSVDCPCGDQEMRPQQWSTTNLGWLIGFICLFTVSCQGDEHTEDDFYDLIPNPSRRSVYFSPIPYFTARSGEGGEWWNSLCGTQDQNFWAKGHQAQNSWANEPQDQNFWENVPQAVNSWENEPQAANSWASVPQAPSFWANVPQAPNFWANVFHQAPNFWANVHPDLNFWENETSDE